MIRKVENSHELIADVQTGETRTGAKLTFGSVCSGIEGASVALSPLGWECRWLYEVDPFCCSVLRFHYSKVTNYGDASQRLQPEPVDLVVGGTPCQSFSVTGNRNGLNDPRGQLALAFPAIAERAKARWIIWENVVGVHSSDGGRDFGQFLHTLAEHGFVGSYRVLTLRTSECPNTGVACTLSDIAETVDSRSPLWLSTRHLQRLRERLLRGGKTPWPELTETATAGAATQRPSVK